MRPMPWIRFTAALGAFAGLTVLVLLILSNPSNAEPGDQGGFEPGRNTFTNPGAAVVDARLAREFRFTERLRWQVMLEGFNVFNRVLITGLNTTQYNVRGAVLFPNTSFQSISATGTNLIRERQLQIGTRFTF